MSMGGGDKEAFRKMAEGGTRPGVMELLGQFQPRAAPPPPPPSPFAGLGAPGPFQPGGQFGAMPGLDPDERGEYAQRRDAFYDRLAPAQERLDRVSQKMRGLDRSDPRYQQLMDRSQKIGSRIEDRRAGFAQRMDKRFNAPDPSPARSAGISPEADIYAMIRAAGMGK